MNQKTTTTAGTRLQRTLSTTSEQGRTRNGHPVDREATRRATTHTSVGRSEQTTIRAGRPRRGTIREWVRQDGDRGFGVAFYDQSGERQYERCGLESEGWSRARAEVALEDFLQAVARGTYAPATDRSGTADPDPLFLNYSVELIAAHGDEVGEKHREFLWNILRNHLMPEFREERLSAVNTAKRLKSFRSKQLSKMRQIRRAAERGTPLRRANRQRLALSERTINHVFSVIGFVIEQAKWDDEIAVVFNAARNPALHVEVPKPTYRDWLEVDEFLSLLDAAELVDQPTRPVTLMQALEARRLRRELGMTVAQTAAKLAIPEARVYYLCSRERVEQVSMTRTIVAVLGASGTRNTELCRLRPIDLDFVHAKIRIPDAKTAAGIREIDMTPWLQKQLEEYVTSLGPDYNPEHPLFVNERGNSFNKDTLNKRLGRVLRAVTLLRRSRKLPPLPTKLTAHAFRRTFITLMIEARAPLSYVQELVGHEDLATTVRIYNRVLKMRDRKQFGRAFDELMANAVPAEVLATTHGEGDVAFDGLHVIGRGEYEVPASRNHARATTHSTAKRSVRMRMVVTHANAA